jgi:hypothetical protein
VIDWRGGVWDRSVGERDRRVGERDRRVGERDRRVGERDRGFRCLRTHNHPTYLFSSTLTSGNIQIIKKREFDNV